MIEDSVHKWVVHGTVHAGPIDYDKEPEGWPIVTQVFVFTVEGTELCTLKVVNNLNDHLNVMAAYESYDWAKRDKLDD